MSLARVSCGMLCGSAHLLAFVDKDIKELVDVDVLILSELEIVLLYQISRRVYLLSFFQCQIRASFDLQELKEVFLDVITA